MESKQHRRTSGWWQIGQWPLWSDKDATGRVQIRMNSMQISRGSLQFSAVLVRCIQWSSQRTETRLLKTQNSMMVRKGQTIDIMWPFEWFKRFLVRQDGIIYFYQLFVIINITAIHNILAHMKNRKIYQISEPANRFHEIVLFLYFPEQQSIFSLIHTKHLYQTIRPAAKPNHRIKLTNPV